MKIINLPTRLFESGDRVITDMGSGTVVHDELEGIPLDDPEYCISHSHVRDAVIVHLDEEDEESGRDEVELDQNEILPLSGNERYTRKNTGSKTPVSDRIAYLIYRESYESNRK